METLRKDSKSGMKDSGKAQKSNSGSRAKSTTTKSTDLKGKVGH